jgi:PKD repeat protein
VLSYDPAGFRNSVRQTMQTQLPAGEWAEDTLSFTVTQPAPNQPPVAAFTYSPTSPQVGQAVHFDASSSHDPDGSIVSYSWNFGDGHTATGVSVTHSYSHAGSYTVRLTVRDDDGRSNTKQQSIIVTNAILPLHADAGGPYVGYVGQSIDFDGSASTGSISKYLWDFGDGYSAQGKLASHVYSSPGKYDVTLTVIGLNSQQASDTTQVTILQTKQGKWVSPTGDFGDGWESRQNAHDGKLATYSSNGRYGENDVGKWTPYLGVTHTLIYINRVRLHFKSKYFTRVNIDVYSVEAQKWISVYNAIPSQTTEWITTNEFSAVLTDKVRIRLQLVNPPRPGYLIRVLIDEVEFHEIFDLSGKANCPPVAEFTYNPITVRVGDIIHFDASKSYDQDGKVVFYSWNFGEGTSAVGMETTHIYTHAGTYTVTLMVRDDKGVESTVTKQITVLP